MSTAVGEPEAHWRHCCCCCCCIFFYSFTLFPLFISSLDLPLRFWHIKHSFIILCEQRHAAAFPRRRLPLSAHPRPTRCTTSRPASSISHSFRLLSHVLLNSDLMKRLQSLTSNTCRCLPVVLPCIKSKCVASLDNGGLKIFSVAHQPEVILSDFTSKMGTVKALRLKTGP